MSGGIGAVGGHTAGLGGMSGGIGGVGAHTAGLGGMSGGIGSAGAHTVGLGAMNGGIGGVHSDALAGLGATNSGVSGVAHTGAGLNTEIAPSQVSDGGSGHGHGAIARQEEGFMFACGASSYYTKSVYPWCNQ